MTVGAFCNRDVVVAESETSVNDAAKLMREFHVGCLIVVQKSDTGNAVLGLVTDRDIVVEVLAQSVDPASLTIGDIMTQDPITAHEDDSLWDTVKKMNIHGIRRLPVVYSNGMLAGLLTTDDLLELLSVELSQLANLFVNEQRREKELRQ